MEKDDFIKKKFQEDDVITDKVNKVFEDFKKNSSKYIGDSKSISELKKNTNNKNQNEKVISFFTYQNINKFLSVTAVFLCVVLVGMGTLLKNRSTEIENIDIITKSVSVKNQELMFSNEEVLKYSENNLVKASIIGDRQIAIQLKENFINLYNLNLSSEKQYEVTNINKNVKDVFVGCMISFDTPYVLLIMEDGTVECIQILYDRVVPTDNYEFNFFSQGKILGLYDVVGFEQCYRNYTNSNTLYYYINAIREDGKKKEIELGYFNNWNDDTSITYNMLNQKYIDKEEEKEVSDDEVDNKTNSEKENSNIKYIQSETDSNIAYYLENSDLYKIDLKTNNSISIASGVTSFYKEEEGQLMAWLDEEYAINEIDYNIIFSEYDVSKASRVVEMKASDTIKVELKDDGSLTLQLLEGALEKLGLKGKTDIKENVRYNIFAESEGVFNKKGYQIADAKTFIVGNIGPDEILSLVYAKTNDTIVCIDLKEAISSNNLSLKRLSVQGIKNIQVFIEDVLYGTSEKGEKVKLYTTVFVIYREKNGNVARRDLSYN